MTMAENDLLRSPKCRLIVITLTCLLGLLVIWPAVDNYCELHRNRAQLIRSLDEARGEAARLPKLETRAAEQIRLLAEVEERSVGETQVDAFRIELAEITRRAGCRLRRIQLEPPHRRPWTVDDHPLTVRPVGKKDQTPYELRAQRISLVVEGPLDSVRDLLARLHGAEKLMHTASFSLRPMDGSEQDVVLDMELIVFALERRKTPKTA